jgi:hypothetical protein
MVQCNILDVRCTNLCLYFQIKGLIRRLCRKIALTRHLSTVSRVGAAPTTGMSWMPDREAQRRNFALT